MRTGSIAVPRDDCFDFTIKRMREQEKPKRIISGKLKKAYRLRNRANHTGGRDCYRCFGICDSVVVGTIRRGVSPSPVRGMANI